MPHSNELPVQESMDGQCLAVYAGPQPAQAAVDLTRGSTDVIAANRLSAGGHNLADLYRRHASGVATCS